MIGIDVTDGSYVFTYHLLCKKEKEKEKDKEAEILQLYGKHKMERLIC